MLKDLVQKNRSYRSFDPERAVAREELLEFVDIARQTSSSRNIQPLKYRLVCTPEECAKVLPLTAWAGRLKNVKLPPEGHAPTAYIVVCCDMTIAETITTFLRDVGIVAQTILLAATEAGLGGCMVGSFDRDKLHSALNIPETSMVMLVLALGKPDERVALVEAQGHDVAYYRADGCHYVPKRPLKDIIL